MGKCMYRTGVAAILLLKVVQATVLIAGPQDVTLEVNQWAQFNCTVDCSYTRSVGWYMAGHHPGIKRNNTIPGLLIKRSPVRCTPLLHEKTYFFEVYATEALNRSTFYCAAYVKHHQERSCSCGTGGRCYSRPALLTVRMAADTTPHPQTRPGIPEICSSPSSFYTLQETTSSEVSAIITSTLTGASADLVPYADTTPPEAITTTTITVTLTVEVTPSLTNSPNSATVLFTDPKDATVEVNEWAQFNCTVSCHYTASWYVAGYSIAIKRNNTVPGLFIKRWRASTCTESGERTHFFEVLATEAFHKSTFYCAAYERSQESCSCGTGGRCYSRPALLTVRIGPTIITPSLTTGIPEITPSPRPSLSFTSQVRMAAAVTSPLQTSAWTPEVPPTVLHTLCKV